MSLSLSLSRSLPIPVLALALSLCAGTSLAQDELIYSGSNSIAMSILFDGGLKAFESKTGLRFDRFDLKGGTTQGLKNLREGRATVVGSSRLLTAEEKKAGQVEYLIGRDVSAFFVNRENPLTSLSSAEAAAILSGKARNWKEIGGKDEPVALVLAPSGTYSNCQEGVGQILLRDIPLCEPEVLAAPPHDRLVEVAERPGGITVASDVGASFTIEPSLMERIKSLEIDGVAPTRKDVLAGKYPLVRPLTLVTQGEATGKLKQFVDFMLSPEGQKLVAAVSIPVKP